MRIPVDYPTPAEEPAIVTRMADEAPEAARLLDPSDVVELQLAARRVTIDDATVDYAIRLILAARDRPSTGPTLVGLLDSARAARVARLVRSARAMAFLRGRERAVAQDVYDVAYDILNARLALSYRATAEGFTIDDVLVELLSTVRAPGSAVWGPPIRTDIRGPPPRLRWHPRHRLRRLPSFPLTAPFGTPARRRRPLLRRSCRHDGFRRSRCDPSHGRGQPAARPDRDADAANPVGGADAADRPPGDPPASR